MTACSGSLKKMRSKTLKEPAGFTKELPMNWTFWEPWLCTRTRSLVFAENRIHESYEHPDNRRGSVFPLLAIHLHSHLHSSRSNKLRKHNAHCPQGSIAKVLQLLKVFRFMSFAMDIDFFLRRHSWVLPMKASLGTNLGSNLVVL